MTNTATDRENISDAANPLGMDGIEFIEFATSKPQILGTYFETMGFRQIARHRSREVTLYRQGTMNLVINAQSADYPRAIVPTARPVISAFAVRLNDSQAALERALDLGAWQVPARARSMELNIPAIHGVGNSLIYLVDRHDEFSIFDVDFRKIPDVTQNPPAIAGLHFFGIVQYVGPDRTGDWEEFYSRLFGFTAVPDSVRFGIMPKGLLLQSPCRKLWLQLVEPEGNAVFAHADEHLNRIGLGTPDVLAAVKNLENRGLEFYSTEHVHTTELGALTTIAAGGVMFELVRAQRPSFAPQS